MDLGGVSRCIMLPALSIDLKTYIEPNERAGTHEEHAEVACSRV